MPEPSMTPDEVLARVSGAQFGCFTRRQAREVGFSDSGIDARLRRRIWRAIHDGVYVATTTPPSRAVTASAARLRVGPTTMFSHVSAARLLAVDIRSEDTRVWLRAPLRSGHRDWPGVRVTRSRHETAPTLAHRQPVVPIERTLVDLSGVLTPRALTGALYDVVRRRLTTVEAVAAEVDVVGGGLRGLRQLRQALATLDPAYEAMVEAHLAGALAAAGLHLTPQVEVRDGPFLLARLDLADEELMLGVEVDGWRYHGSREAQDRDRRRDRLLQSLGWVITRFDAVTALEQTDRAVAEVLAIRARLARDRGRRAG